MRPYHAFRKRRWRCPVGGALAAAAVCPLIAPAQTGTPIYAADPTVHDPSVIRVAERYYVFGSHGASAWTEDLMNWTQVASGVNSGNPPHFVTFKSELAELIQWTQADSLWAPDVIQLGDERFYYYYNVWTNHLGYRSYMGLAVADAIEGPYVHVSEILRGGTGVAGFNPSVHPNTIDPALLHDPGGNLWMVYGSYSGGIFILRMDPQTGLPLPGQGYGTHLAGGEHGRIEGPYILYNPDTGYYYLFLSFGGLDPQGGYNIRVARARAIDGPYLDAAGTDLATVRGAPGTVFDDASIAPHGVKLMGNYRFLHEPGEPLTESRGYVSPGHNSAYHDPERGKYYLFFHTRFHGRGDIHEVRVHQMYFNTDDWPVIAPHRYAGETLTRYRPELLHGRFKVILHGKDISPQVKHSAVVELHAGGSVSGAFAGNWEFEAPHDLRITLDGIPYRGVVSHQWDDDNRSWVMAFSCLSSDGAALWGSQVAEHRSPIEAWRLIRLGNSANAGLAADFADPDGDGVPNLVEYALRSDPSKADNPLQLTAPEDHLRLRFERIMDPTLRYSVEASDGLDGPTETIWSSEGTSNRIGAVEVEVPVAGEQGDAPFLRVQVTR